MGTPYGDLGEEFQRAADGSPSLRSLELPDVELLQVQHRLERALRRSDVWP